MASEVIMQRDRSRGQGVTLELIAAPLHRAEPAVPQQHIHQADRFDGLIPLSVLESCASRWEIKYRTATPCRSNISAP